MPPGGITVLDAVIAASPAGESDTSFRPVPGAVYRRVRVVRPGLAAVTVDIARAMRGGSDAGRRIGPGEIVIVPARTGPWSEDQIERELEGHRERAVGEGGSE